MINELRLRNLLKYGDNIVSVNSIFSSHFMCSDVITGIDYGPSVQSNYQPIPLSPSVLEAAGFEKINNAWDIDMNHDDTFFSLFDHNYCSGELNLKYNVENGPTPKVKYLHQLQNLYFALTGTELTIDINKLK